MSRSLYKPKYVHKSIFEDCLKNKENNSKIIVYDNKNIPRFHYFWAKNSLINMNLLDKKIAIYNGKVFITLNVLKQVIGYKLGSFCITRKKPPHTGKQKQVKKVSRTRERMVAQRRKVIIRGRGNLKKRIV